MVRIQIVETFMTTEEILLTEHDLSALTKKSVRTLQGQRVRGDGIPFVKLGAHVRYRMADIESYLAAHTRRSTSDTSEAA